MHTVIRMAAIGAIAAVATLPASAQKPNMADIARRMSGTWTINRKLSPTFGAGRSGPGRGRGGGALFQRGGGRGNPASEPGSEDLTPAELAERQAMSQARLIAPTITVVATPEQVSFTDERGEFACALNDKGHKQKLFGIDMDVKCKWDKDRLRQEFSTTSSKLIRLWDLNDSDQLVLKAKLEGQNQNTPEATAVFDRSK